MNLSNNKAMKKIISKKGSERTLIAFVVVSIPILYFFLILSSWKIYDSQYNYIDNHIESVVSIITKTGVIHPNLDVQLKANIEKILGVNDNYELEYFYINYDNLKDKLDISNPDGEDYPLPEKVDSPIGQQFKTGDIVYIQLKSFREPLYSKLINLLSSNNSNEDVQMIVLHHGMVEVNAY